MTAQKPETASASPTNLEELDTRQRELERRVALLERNVRGLMARLTQDELEQFDRVEG